MSTKKLKQCEVCRGDMVGTDRKRFCSDACRKRQSRGAQTEVPMSEKLAALSMGQRRRFARYLEAKPSQDVLPEPLVPADLALSFPEALDKFGEYSPEMTALGWQLGDRLDWFLAEEAEDPEVEFDKLRAARQAMEAAS